MGIGPSYRHVYHDVVSVSRWQKDFEALHLAEADVGKMFKIYREIDDDNSGTIQVIELLNFLDIERTRFLIMRCISKAGKRSAGCFRRNSRKMSLSTSACSVWIFSEILKFSVPNRIVILHLVACLFFS